MNSEYKRGLQKALAQQRAKAFSVNAAYTQFLSMNGFKEVRPISLTKLVSRSSPVQGDTPEPDST